ncbi:MAG: hypothetical protein WC533_02550 [Candidatus Pacearchaeota archaeon]
MKKICIVGKDMENSKKLKEHLLKLGFEYSEENPSLVIAYGGDGTLLIAERQFPGVLKILVKDSNTSSKACNLHIEDIIKKYLAHDYEIEIINKLKAIANLSSKTRELTGMNDIVIRNTLPTEAVRFESFINNKLIGEFIGDGVVIATPYGSTAYFHSITRKNICNGIGIAFNNITAEKPLLNLENKERIKFKILRGPAVLVADNNRDFINLEKGDEVEIFQGDEFAKIIRFRQ